MCGLYAAAHHSMYIYTGTNTILITVTISAEYIFFNMQFEMNKFWKFGYLKLFEF